MIIHADCMDLDHMLTVVYRRRVKDRWSRTYWLVCYTCSEFVEGPYDRLEAWEIVHKYERLRLQEVLGEA